MYALYFAITTALICSKVSAFSPHPSCPVSNRSASSRLSLASDEMLSKARQAPSKKAIEEENERPKLFDESIYADIASAYDKLDKRFKDGPGSLTAVELIDLEVELTRIGDEMKQNQHMRPNRPSLAVLEMPNSVAGAARDQNSNTAPENDPEDFDGRFGVPAGTTNTYAIEGMDEMTAEEYQVAIQEAVSAKQRQRRAASTFVGNQTAQNYLNNLGK
jgi:hypothetical protein